VSFTDAALDTGHWCTRRECTDVFANLDNVLQHDEDFLNRCIASASQRAQSILRGRWPASWPFTTPPEEVRQAVSTLAVYRALRKTTYSGGALEITDHLKADADDALKWLHAIADSELHLTSGLQTEGIGRAIAGGAPEGEFGFGAR